VSDLIDQILPDGDPEIIELLRAIFLNKFFEIEMHESAWDEVKNILSTWEQRGDLAELRSLLGMDRPKRRPRKERAAIRRFDIATEYFRLRQQNVRDASQIVGDKFGASKRTVERALEEFKYFIDPGLSDTDQGRALRQEYKVRVEMRKKYTI